MSANRHISLPKTFASGDVGEWFKRFEICCSANEWNNTTKAAKLPTLLEGEALAIWLELNEDTQKDYKEAKKKIIEKMAPQAFVSLDDFHKRRLHPGEPISVYVHELKKLLDQAMPGLDTGARDQLLLHQFLAGIPRDISKPIRAASDVKSLDQAMERARLLMAVDSEGPSPVAAVSDTTAYSTQLQELQGQISELTERPCCLRKDELHPGHPYGVTIAVELVTCDVNVQPDAECRMAGIVSIAAHLVTCNETALCHDEAILRETTEGRLHRATVVPVRCKPGRHTNSNCSHYQDQCCYHLWKHWGKCCANDAGLRVITFPAAA